MDNIGNKVKVGERFNFHFTSGKFEGTNSFGQATKVENEFIVADCGSQGTHNIPKKDVRSIWPDYLNLKKETVKTEEQP